MCVTVQRNSSFRIAGCYSMHTRTIHPSHMRDELIEGLQKTRLSGVLGAFRSRTVYANACQETAGTPRRWHINIHVQMLSEEERADSALILLEGRGKRGLWQEAKTGQSSTES